jgi:CxxC-x17-CxxC domain-containing protein
MFPAVCANCGRDTEVPFQPRGDSPVYCRDCFQQRAPDRGAGGGSGRGGDRGGDRGGNRGGGGGGGRRY